MSDDRELPDWIATHMKRYLETNGEEGHIWNGVPCLLLTTKGKKSGEPRTLPLIYGESEGCYVIVASKGGNAFNPLWYENLAANAEVQLQVGADKFKARARTAAGEERQSLWAVMEKIWPDYNEYQEKTTRQIPVVVLERM